MIFTLNGGLTATLMQQLIVSSDEPSMVEPTPAVYVSLNDWLSAGTESGLCQFDLVLMMKMLPKRWLICYNYSNDPNSVELY
jgi:hypothetical protein